MSSIQQETAVKGQASRGRLGYLLGTVAVIAVTAGVVAGITWSGGGRWAFAEGDPAPQVLRAPSGGGSGAPVAVTGPFRGAMPPSMADLVEHVAPAVVTVKVKVEGGRGQAERSPLRDFFDQFERRRGTPAPETPRQRNPEVQGSGFIIDPSGIIVTNNHVVDDPGEVSVEVADGKTYKAKIIGRDEGTDIAVLKVEAPKPLPSVTFADDKKVRVGDWVLAVGNPFGLGGTVTAGIVSARGREIGGGPYTDYLQIDAAINRGNSGGPTFDMQGHVVGMNTAIYSPTGGSVGIGFAIPASIVQEVVSDLRKSGEVTRGWLGVQIRSLDEDTALSLGLSDTKGAFVASIVEGSPAEKAGFKEQDVVLEINGVAVDSNRDMTRKVGSLNVGDTATFVVWRDGKKVTIRATIAKREAEQRVSGLERDGDGGGDSARARVADLGLGVAPLTADRRDEFDIGASETGVVITDIDPDSDAAIKGLRQGERITAIGQTEVKSVGDVEKGIENATKAGRKSVLLKVENARGSRYVAVRIGKG